MNKINFVQYLEIYSFVIFFSNNFFLKSRKNSLLLNGQRAMLKSYTWGAGTKTCWCKFKTQNGILCNDLAFWKRPNWKKQITISSIFHLCHNQCLRYLHHLPDIFSYWSFTSGLYPVSALNCSEPHF